jgi:hypothetical protein
VEEGLTMTRARLIGVAVGAAFGAAFGLATGLFVAWFKG